METVSEFNEISKKDNYYQLKYEEGTSLDQLRKVLLSYGVDFDKKHVLITDKSYYQN